MPKYDIEDFYSQDHHKVYLINESRNSSGVSGIEGWLSSPIEIATSASYSDVLGNRGDNILQFITSRTMNRSTNVQMFTEQVWTGSEVPTFTFNLSRLALHSTKGEILDPTSEMLSWTVPPTLTTPLQPPVDFKNQKFVTIRVGNWLELTKMIPKDVNFKYDMALDHDGRRPIRYDGTITFVCHKLPVASDIKAWFK